MHRPLKNKAQQALDTARGGRRVKVTLKTTGREEDVFVHQLPLRFLELFIALSLDGDEQGIIELCLGCHAAWDKKFAGKHIADKYDIGSQVLLLEAANAINFQAALAQIERRKNTVGSLEPMLKRLYAAQGDMMKEAMIKLTQDVVVSALSSLPESRSSGAPTRKSGTTGASNASSSPSGSSTPTGAPPPSATSTPSSTPPKPPGEAATPPTP